MNAKIFTVEYTHPTLGVYYMADFQYSQKSDFTEDKRQALPMDLNTASKAVARSVNPAKVVPIR